MNKELKEIDNGIEETISIIKKMEAHPNPSRQQQKILLEVKHQLKQLMNVRDNYVILDSFREK